jgi:DNA-binding HxlR family transcriptional regulator
VTKEDASSDPAIMRGCPLDKVFRLLSGEWTTHILWVLSKNGPTRYGALRRQIGNISSKVLTDRLRMLEAEGIVFRNYEPTVPPAVTYGLTTSGRRLDSALRAIEKVAQNWR